MDIFNNENNEYILEIDENNNIKKIPYSIGLEIFGIEFVKNLMKINNEKDRFEIEKDKWLNFDKHYYEVKELKDAKELLVVDITYGAACYELITIKEGIDEDYVKELEKNNNIKVYYVIYDKNKDLRRRKKKKLN